MKIEVKFIIDTTEPLESMLDGLNKVEAALSDCKTSLGTSMPVSDIKKSRKVDAAAIDQAVVDEENDQEDEAEEAPVAPPAKKAKLAPAKIVTADEVKAACLAHTKRHDDVNATIAILKKVGGAAKVNLIDSAKYPELLKALKA